MANPTLPSGFRLGRNCGPAPGLIFAVLMERRKKGDKKGVELKALADALDLDMDGLYAALDVLTGEGWLKGLGMPWREVSTIALGAPSIEIRPGQQRMDLDSDDESDIDREDFPAVPRRTREEVGFEALPYGDVWLKCTVTPIFQSEDSDVVERHILRVTARDLGSEDEIVKVDDPETFLTHLEAWAYWDQWREGYSPDAAASDEETEKQDELPPEPKFLEFSFDIEGDLIAVRFEDVGAGWYRVRFCGRVGEREERVESVRKRGIVGDAEQWAKERATELRNTYLNSLQAAVSE